MKIIFNYDVWTGNILRKKGNVYEIREEEAIEYINAGIAYFTEEEVKAIEKDIKEKAPKRKSK